MNEQSIIRLYQLADAKRKENIGCCAEMHPLGTPDMALYHLACEMRGVASLTDSDSLHTFLTADGAALLLKMPNWHFFWAVLSRAALAADALPLDKKSVQTAVWELRRDLSSKYNVRKTLAQLNGEPLALAGKVASRCSVGLALLKRGFGESDVVVDNPIFFDKEFLGES